ncbi:hypothetical protein SDC9_142342 [bioreactor metagenome]|uniref:Uncharacterized protein n=1 Tax=bioreactor metagenome TaxID=1076179 RepID=A0A645E0W6_9ZZZZ
MLKERLNKVLLHSRALHVALGIPAETHQLHGMLPVQVLHALLEVDIEALRGV